MDLLSKISEQYMSTRSKVSNNQELLAINYRAGILTEFRYKIVINIFTHSICPKFCNWSSIEFV